MLSCSEVTRLCGSEEVLGVSLSRRIGVRIHLMMCSNCRRYLKEVRLIGAAARHEFRRRWTDRGRVEALERSVRERLRAEIDGSRGDAGPPAP